MDNLKTFNTMNKTLRMIYGFRGASWSSAAFFCAGLKAEMSTPVLGALVLNGTRAGYAIGRLGSANPIYR